MEYITYVEIENFKGFHDKIRVDLRSPSVLIGPNNAGKTTVIQALSLWSRALNAWHDKKGGKKSLERYGVGINRLTIFDVPVRECRYFWNSTKVRNGNTQIEFSICVGVLIEGQEHALKMSFSNRDQESLSCKPDNAIIGNDALFLAAKKLFFNLLYPMSGIAAAASQSTEEYLMNDGQVRVLMGQGQTASVLRNLCYKVFTENKQDWLFLRNLMAVLFDIELSDPDYNSQNSILSLTYHEKDVENNLDIALSGRGMQQILLILAYLYSHKGSVLMIDEPDAHLEILRQRQVFAILKDVAEKTKCQIIIATHSEVILDEALETNLTFLIKGTSEELSKSGIKTTLRNLGVEHYYKAKVCPRLLIVEGSTDVDILRSFANKLDHPARAIFADKLNAYYTQNINSEASLENTLDQIAVSGVNYKNYFFTLQQLVPELKGVAIFDSDGISRRDENPSSAFGISFYKRYEIENYFITPENLIKYVDWVSEADELFASISHKNIEAAAYEKLADLFFGGDLSKIDDYRNASPVIKEQLLSSKKMSSYAEEVFLRFAQLQGQPVLLNKGEFYKIIDMISATEVPHEIAEKLDMIVHYLSP